MDAVSINFYIFMPSGPRQGSAAKAAAEATVLYRRAGHGWNKHSDAALDSGLRRASQHGVLSMHSRYGGLEMRFDFVNQKVQLAEVKTLKTVDEGGADSDIVMRDSQPATAGQPADAAAVHAASTAEEPQHSAPAASAAEMKKLSDRLAVLSAKDSKHREAKARQRKNKRAKAAAAKVAAAPAAAPTAAPAFTFGSLVDSAVSNSPAAAPPAVGAFTWPPTAPASSGGVTPSLPQGFRAGASSSMPPGLAPAAASGGVAQNTPIYVPAFGGHMPRAEACMRLCGAISEANLSQARLQCVPRYCVFPNGVPRRELMLHGGSVAAQMSETELGAKLTAMLDGGLTAESLRRHIGELFALPPRDWSAAVPAGTFL